MTDEDTRILNMRINNKEFLKGTSDSLNALNTLNKGLDSAGKNKGLQGMGSNIDTVKTKFGALQVAGVAALATITSKLVNTGLRIGKSLAIDPILDGYREYNKLLTSTQTILANTGAPLDDINDALNDLNTYSDNTVYNFGQMADAIGKFTAASKISLPNATASIKGLANTAALAGSTNEQLGTAFYQMSQALATGTIKLMDWNSLVNAGMGGSNIQEAFKATARTLNGVAGTVDKLIKKNGSFRDSLQEGWLTGDVFNKTMRVMAGVTKDVEGSQGLLQKTVAYSVEELKKMGYSTQAAKTLHDLSQRSIEAANKVKTFSQLIDVTKEALGSGWAQIFRSLFGDLNEASSMWTNLNNIMGATIKTVFKRITDALDTWHNMSDVFDGKRLNGFQQAWGAIGNIFQTIGNLLHPFLTLFGALTPSSENAGSALYGLTNNFYKFSLFLEKVTSGIRILDPAITAIGWTIGTVAGFVLDLVGAFYEFVATGDNVKKVLVSFANAISSLVVKFAELVGIKDDIVAFFDVFDGAKNTVIDSLAKTVDNLGKAFRALFSGDAIGAHEAFKDAFKSLFPINDMLVQAREAAGNIIEGLINGLDSGKIQAAVSDFANKIITFFKQLFGIHSPSTVFEGFGGDIVDGLANGLASGVTGILDIIGSVFSAIGNYFKDFDRFDLANLFSVIFSAVTFKLIYDFIKALSSTMNSFKGFGDVLGGITNTMNAMQTKLKADAILSIALAIGVLAVSLWVLSKIPLPQLAKGLLTIAIMIKLVVVAVEHIADKVESKGKELAKAAVLMIALGSAMILMATAVLILAAAVFVFGKMDSGTLAKGLLAITVALGVMAGVALLLGKVAPSMILASAGILILSVALAALAPVILLFSKIKWSTLFSGISKIAAALVILTLAIIPMALFAPQILIASAALVVLSVALASMAGVIKLFSTMSWGTVIGGIAKMGAALIILGVAALIAAPGLILLGAAAILLGAGLLAAGLGLTLAGAGLTVLVAAGAAGTAILISAIESFLALLPVMGVQFVSALDVILRAVADKYPSIIDSLVKIVSEALRGIRELAPEIAETGVAILQALIDAIVQNQQYFFNKGFELLQGFLDTIEQRLPEILESGTNIIVKFVRGLGSGASEIAIAAGDALLDFLEAIEAWVNDEGNVERIVEAGMSIGGGIVQGIIKGLIPDPIYNAIDGVIGGLIEKAKKILGIHSPSTVFTNIGKEIVNGLKNGIAGLPGTILGIIPAVLIAAGRLGSSVVTGIKNGLSNIGSALGGLADSVLSAVKSTINTILPISIPRFTIPNPLGPDPVIGPFTVLPRIPGFAKGTDYFGGGLALVGEVGPELVSMNKGSSVITNKNLVGFMNAIAKLSTVMSRGMTKSEDSSGGRISYMIDASLKGDPRQNGTQFASKIIAGLADGLNVSIPKVNKSIVSIGNTLSRMTSSRLEEEAKKIYLGASGNIGNAKSAYDAYKKAMAEAETAKSDVPVEQKVTFEQNNYSPEAISHADAYRAGKSLVSIMEKKLEPTP